MQRALNQHANIINTIQQDLKHKSYERTLGDYLSTVAEGIHKECGERPHGLRLEDLEKGSEIYLTQDSNVLKHAIDKFHGKMEIVSTNIINLNKFKSRTEHRIKMLEDLTKKQIKVEQFMVEKKKMGKELYEHCNEKLGTFSERLVQLSKDIEEK